MKCPLLLMTLGPQIAVQGDLDADAFARVAEAVARASECMRDECGWWIPEAEMCAAKAMGLRALRTEVSTNVTVDDLKGSH